MKINEFKKLEEKINGQNFNQGYKNINVVMLLLSIFGHFASIFLAYFALSKVLGGVIENNPAAVFIASIIMLSGQIMSVTQSSYATVTDQFDACAFAGDY